jgi:hypothetical protein
VKSETSKHRLQRSPDFTGGYLTRFRQVWLRHGLPGALLGLLCLAYPEMRLMLVASLEGFLTNPVKYSTMGLFILGALISYIWVIDRAIDARVVAWILYALAISIWEEWVFRLAVPYFAQAEGVNLFAAIVLSNLAFGVLHYFTLRWKWQWCLGAFVGGMLFSRMLHTHGDLALVIAVHWISTFLNTPRPPGGCRRQ